MAFRNECRYEYQNIKASLCIIDRHIRPYQTNFQKRTRSNLNSYRTNDLTDNHNYLNNVRKIVKMVRGTCKDTKLCFFSLICRANLKDIDEKEIKTNTHLENYCKQQNLDFIDNIKKSDLKSTVLHLGNRGSSKLVKNFLDCL